MVANINDFSNGFQDRKLCAALNAYESYVNFRFDYVIRQCLIRPPDELNYNRDYSIFDPSQKILLACINSSNDENNVTKLRGEYKKLISEINSKRKEVHIVALQEQGVRNNIKHLQEIITIKESFIDETANYAQIRCDAKYKIQKKYNKVYKKYNSILSQFQKATKSLNPNSSSKTNKHVDNLTERVKRYEAKIKKMDDVIRIADESKEKLEQYHIALKTSKDRLQTFNELLNNHVKNKHELTYFLNSKEKVVKQLKLNLSNLGVLSSIEKSRNHTSSNCIKNNCLKKDFVDLQNMRNEVLSARPKEMFNPKYQKDKNATKEEIRKYVENVEAIDSIDYLIELKNVENNSELSLLQFIQMNAKDSNIFIRCLSTLNKDEMKKLLVHYFTKTVDLIESGRENDDIIAELDESINRYKQTILTLNNSFQEFHLSTEKKFALLKQNYEDKVNSLFSLFKDDNNALTVLKLKQEILNLKKQVIELEKEKARLAKSKMVTVLSHEQYARGLEQLEASKLAAAEAASSAAVTINKNKIKIKIKKNKSK